MYACVTGVCVCVRKKFSLTKSCQDVSSFGSSLSRCPIFWQVTRVHCVCMCGVHVCVCEREKFSLRAVKMSHLSAAACQDVPSFGR